jgi:hypothetical protein
MASVRRHIGATLVGVMALATVSLAAAAVRDVHVVRHTRLQGDDLRRRCARVRDDDGAGAECECTARGGQVLERWRPRNRALRARSHSTRIWRSVKRMAIGSKREAACRPSSAAGIGCLSFFVGSRTSRANDASWFRRRARRREDRCGGASTVVSSAGHATAVVSARASARSKEQAR